MATAIEYFLNHLNIVPEELLSLAGILYKLSTLPDNKQYTIQHEEQKTWFRVFETMKNEDILIDSTLPTLKRLTINDKRIIILKLFSLFIQKNNLDMMVTYCYNWPELRDLLHILLKTKNPRITFNDYQSLYQKIKMTRPITTINDNPYDMFNSPRNKLETFLFACDYLIIIRKNLTKKFIELYINLLK